MPTAKPRKLPARKYVRRKPRAAAPAIPNKRRHADKAPTETEELRSRVRFWDRQNYQWRYRVPRCKDIVERAIALEIARCLEIPEIRKEVLAHETRAQVDADEARALNESQVGATPAVA